jgi:hypothetical protein
MSDFKLPSFTVDLIPLLDAHFPNQCPSISMSDREVWFKAGQASVVSYLKHWSSVEEDELESILTN